MGQSIGRFFREMEMLISPGRVARRMRRKIAPLLKAYPLERRTTYKPHLRKTPEGRTSLVVFERALAPEAYV
jgi:hypothetical protein